MFRLIIFEINVLFVQMTNSSTGQMVANTSVGGLRWTNKNVLIETDISKCGITDETTTNRLDLSRRNTCPNPPAYRPLVHREAMAALQQQQQQHQQQSSNTGRAATGHVPTIGATGRTPLAVKFSRHQRTNNNSSYLPLVQRPLLGGHLDRVTGGVLKDIGNQDLRSGGGATAAGGDSKRNSSAQTVISALPEHWRSESHLGGGGDGGGQLCGDGAFYTLPSQYVPPAAPKPGDLNAGK